MLPISCELVILVDLTTFWGNLRNILKRTCLCFFFFFLKISFQYRKKNKFDHNDYAGGVTSIIQKQSSKGVLKIYSEFTGDRQAEVWFQ